jgi:hypothetical protein
VRTPESAPCASGGDVDSVAGRTLVKSKSQSISVSEEDGLGELSGAVGPTSPPFSAGSGWDPATPSFGASVETRPGDRIALVQTRRGIRFDAGSSVACRGVGAWNVGGAAHNGDMINTERCERCDGSGADPQQAWFDDEVALCVDCRGDGMVLIVEERVGQRHEHYELALTA